MTQLQNAYRPIVLVIEDEPMQRMMAVDMIEEAGFDVVEARDATDGIRILEARTDIRLVFADLDVPNSADALRLAATIRDRWPPIHVILISGRFGKKDISIPADTVFFLKPYQHAQVTREMRRMLADASNG